MTAPNFYRVLGVPPTASDGEVRAAYARLVRRHHPDVDGELPKRLAEVQQAYRCLSDPGARARHDRHIADRERSHIARQRRIRRRLDRYDRHHPPPPSLPWHRRWRLLLVVGLGSIAILLIAVGLFGAEPG